MTQNPQPTPQDQVIAIMSALDDSFTLNYADETGVYYSCRGGSGFIETHEYQDFIDAHAPIAPNSGGNLWAIFLIGYGNLSLMACYFALPCFAVLWWCLFLCQF